MVMSPTEGENGIRIEDIGGMLTDVLRLEPADDPHFPPDAAETAKSNDCPQRVLFFVVPGNPGTLAFYKGSSLSMQSIA